MAGKSLPEQAKALLDELEHRSRMPEGAQHRRAHRYPYRHELELERREEGLLVRSLAYSRDLSAGGIGCLHFEPLALKSQVKLHLPALGAKVVVTPARVVHCRQVREDWWLVGLAFEQLIDPMDFV